jgi:hypothetical protein
MKWPHPNCTCCTFHCILKKSKLSQSFNYQRSVQAINNAGMKLGLGCTPFFWCTPLILAQEGWGKRFMSLRLAWATWWVQGQLGLKDPVLKTRSVHNLKRWYHQKCYRKVKWHYKGICIVPFSVDTDCSSLIQQTFERHSAVLRYSQGLAE